jgi:hypothetical protein
MGQGDLSLPSPLLPRMTLGELCAASWVSQSLPAVTQPGIEPGSVVMPQWCLRPLYHSGGPRKFNKQLVPPKMYPSVEFQNPNVALKPKSLPTPVLERNPRPLGEALVTTIDVGLKVFVL